MKRKRRIGISIVLLAIIVIAIWFGIDYRSRPRLVTGPMVQMLTPEGFTLVWQMHPERDAIVHVHEENGNFDRRYPSTFEDDQHVAAVTGLKTGQTYAYEITADNRILARNSVRTSPPAGKPYRFVAFGDSGRGNADQYRVARLLSPYNPDLIIHTGDLIYPNGERKDYPANFYRPYADLIARVPFYPCLGNHDVVADDGQPLLDVFVLPRNGPAGETPERNYWFDYSDARFIALDSNLDKVQLAQRVVPWLDQVLASAGDRWKFVYFHEPFYTHGTHDRAFKLQATVAPVFDRYQVQLVLCGHNHLYERTYPMRTGRRAADGHGTVYVTTGAGGAPLYHEKPAPPDFMAAWDDSQHSFTVVDVAPAMLTLRQIGEERAVLDEVHIPRRAQALTTTQAVAEAR